MPKRTDRQTYFRSKSVVLTERDELAFGRVLREFGSRAGQRGMVMIFSDLFDAPEEILLDSLSGHRGSGPFRC